MEGEKLQVKNYLDVGKEILVEGSLLETRSGNTIATTGKTLTFDLRDGFPLLTTKYIKFHNILHETIWYLMGTGSIDYLQEHGINIWNLWADENNDLGPTYGVQWRDFEGIDQVAEVVHDIQHNPHRRLIINGWNVPRIPEMALPPCLVLMQYHVQGDVLHSTVYQRSADWAIGVPYDIAEMALLLEIFANITGKQAGKLTMFYGDAHIYENHVEKFKMQLTRTPKELPKLVIDEKIKDVDSIDPEKIRIERYDSDGFIKYPISKWGENMRLTWEDKNGIRTYFVDGKEFAYILLENLTDELHWKLVKDFEDF